MWRKSIEVSKVVIIRCGSSKYNWARYDDPDYKKNHEIDASFIDSSLSA